MTDRHGILADCTCTSSCFIILIVCSLRQFTIFNFISQGSLADCTCGYNIFNGRRKRSSSNSWDNPPGCESFCLSTGWKVIDLFFRYSIFLLLCGTSENVKYIYRVSITLSQQRIGTCNCGTYVLAMKRSKPSYEKPKRAAALIHQRYRNCSLFKM